MQEWDVSLTKVRDGPAEKEVRGARAWRKKD